MKTSHRAASAPALAFPFALALAAALLCGCDGRPPDSTAAAAPADREARAMPSVTVAPDMPAAKPLTSSFYGTPFEKQPDVATLTSLGRRLFFEHALSASGQLACATCHSPDHAFGPPNRLPVQFGGVDGRLPGLRAVPSLMYQQDAPPFSEHFNDTDGDDSVDQGPTGGRDWDGRASSAHEQASGPLLSPFEMANPDRESMIERLMHSPSAAAFRDAFGTHVFEDRGHAWNGVLLALEVFQQSPTDFYPYSSKYDAVLRGQARLTRGEAHGLALFNDANKANCLQCHPSAMKRGAFPQFTDRGFIAIGVPRNARIPANRDAHYHDLGLCGPLRDDLADHPEYCGLFKTPSLRNVATRSSFFHNGQMHSLEDVVRFYSERDVQPSRFYPKDKNGRVMKFDDLPEQYRKNLNGETPFDRTAGDKPVLTEAEIKDLVAFLKTLTDGYVAAKQVPAH
jgi:cytochrome c peroxidase